MGVPALFTCYNSDEAVNEKALWAGLGGEFVMGPQENKWRSLVREMEFLDREGGIWEQNAWCYVVKGKKEG